MTVKDELNALEKTFPRLSDFFDAVSEVTYPPRRDMHLLDAIVAVVNSQMLSTKAATAIFDRISAQARRRRVKYLANLKPEVLRECGMSHGKIRSIGELRERYKKDTERYEQWSSLSFEELCAEVDEIWGISTWTAEMLAMFYFGHKDVFPTKDLAINRGVALIRTHIDADFDQMQAKPYRTLMARCLWHSFDIKYWDGFK